MKYTLNTLATPLVTGLFLVSALSGIALFFHWSPSAFHAMHEWLSMLLLVPFILHVWRNWHPLLGYLRRKTLLVPMAVSLLLAVPFAAVGISGPSSHPAFRAVEAMNQARLSDLAPILQTSPEALLVSLKKSGYQVASTEETLQAVADAAAEPAHKVLFAILPAR